MKILSKIKTSRKEKDLKKWHKLMDDKRDEHRNDKSDEIEAVVRIKMLSSKDYSINDPTGSYAIKDVANSLFGLFGSTVSAIEVISSERKEPSSSDALKMRFINRIKADSFRKAKVWDVKFCFYGCGPIAVEDEIGKTYGIMVTPIDENTAEISCRCVKRDKTKETVSIDDLYEKLLNIFENHQCEPAGG